MHYRILEEFRGIRESYEDRITAFQRIIGDIGLLYVEVRILWIARMIELVEQNLVDKKNALYTTEMVEIGKKFIEEIIAAKPSSEFRRWVARAAPGVPVPGQGQFQLETKAAEAGGRGARAPVHSRPSGKNESVPAERKRARKAR